MDTKVNEFIELNTINNQVEVENAKQVLKRNGYYVDNLWQTCDVTMNYDCTEEQAQEVLDNVLTNDFTFQYIFDAIKLEAEDLKLSSL